MPGCESHLTPFTEILDCLSFRAYKAFALASMPLKPLEPQISAVLGTFGLENLMLLGRRRRYSARLSSPCFFESSV